jgi:uroporphyrinogen-III decarboxylase
MEFSREKYIELMAFGHYERSMFSELFGLMVGLDEEWRRQGASEDELSLVGFDWDYVPYIECGGVTGAFGTPKAEIIEETREFRIERDYLGRTTQLFKSSATIPLPLDFPVKEMDDWLKLKHHYEYTEARIDWEALDLAARAQQGGVLVRAEIPGGWDTPRELMGDEGACVAYYNEPEMMRDILRTLEDTCKKVLERVSEELVIDQLFVHEDLAGKGGPLVGPKQLYDYVVPYYKSCWNVVSGRGTRLFNLDSDGDINPVIDAFLDGGVNVVHPFEPASGMDIVAVRKKYGNRLAMLGGIDKHVLRLGKEEIREELEYKMQPLMRRGGTVFGLDHRIPNGTPLENYRYYVETGRDILGLPPLERKSKGWGRMAF